MNELKLMPKLKGTLEDFIQGLKDKYQDGLISIILYGSAASGEFTDKYSNINLMVVLNNASLENLSKISNLINKRKFDKFHTVFFTKDNINTSCNVFPIEFLDMKENYVVLLGEDVLKNLKIDIRNLRFQCEQELKAKLINLRQLYLRLNKDKVSLQGLLFKSFTSILHILRNVLRIKGKEPPYKKEDILKALALEFKIDLKIWEKILAAKNKQIKLNNKDIEDLFINFVKELEKTADIIDTL